MNRRVIIGVTILLAAAVSVLCIAACASPPGDRDGGDGDYIIGVSYFAGWWGRHDGWAKNLQDARLLYPERVPLLGTLISQETMDREIIAASEYGVDYFQILWYPHYSPDVINTEGAQRLNEGVTFFMDSPENHRMRFSVEYCNHLPFRVTDEDSWKEICAELVSFMHHPQYLRIGGKPMLKIHTIRNFVTDAGGMRTAMSWITYLRALAREEGVGELLLGAGATASDTFAGAQVLLEDFDYIQYYMDIPDFAPREKDYRYNLLMKRALDVAQIRAASPLLPYLPYIPAGWKPWFGGLGPFFSMPGRTQWRKALSDMKKMVDRNSRLRIPDGTESGQKMINIYAWNEFSEGGIVAPNHGEGYMKLEEIRRVFK